MVATQEYQVTGMTCGHCESSISELVGQIAGVDEVDVSAQTGRLAVTGIDSIDDAAVLAAVTEAGYSAVLAD